MRVRVKLFGAEAAAAGRAFVDADAPPGATAGEIKAAAARQCPPLAPLVGPARLAVNCEFVPDSRVVSPADEIALIGLVSGG